MSFLLLFPVIPQPADVPLNGIEGVVILIPSHIGVDIGELESFEIEVVEFVTFSFHRYLAPVPLSGGAVANRCLLLHHRPCIVPLRHELPVAEASGE